MKKPKPRAQVAPLSLRLGPATGVRPAGAHKGAELARAQIRALLAKQIRRGDFED